MRKLDRREFVMGVGGAAVASAASPAQVFAQQVFAQQVFVQAEPSKPTPQLAVRRTIGSMAPNDPALASYRRAVERMKELPASDPRNWNRIAQIHVDFCPHGNWFFLPWHRAYLVAFERLCRHMSGDPNFVLPYWDWTEQRQLPPAFTTPTEAGRRNPLYDNARQMRANASLRESAVGPHVIARIMAETNYEMFGSTRPAGQDSTEARWLRAPGRTTLLEGGPHNTTHVAVGGDMGNMISPRDPIFWLHHCNVDRLWARWNALGGRNAVSRLWTTFEFNGMFQVPQGEGTTAFDVRVRDMLDHKAWGYTYPDLPSPDQPSADRVVAASEADLPAPRPLASEAATGVARLNTVLSTRLSLPQRESGTSVRIKDRAGDAARTVRNANAALRGEEVDGGSAATTPAAAAASAPNPVPGVPNRRIFSVLEKIGATIGDAMIVNVFLNSPNPTPDTPDDDPHFVGTFGLFGLQSHAAHGGLTVQVELTDAIARLRRVNQAIGSQIELQLIPVETQGANLQMKLDRVNIVTM